jgi:hypothetical protein
MLANPGEPNEQTALEWMKYIDGIDIFPTTPFYLRMRHTKRMRIQRVKDSIKNLRQRHALLQRLNTTTLPEITRGSRVGANGAHAMALTNRPGFETVQGEISFDGREAEEAPVLVGTAAVNRASTLDVNVTRTRGV